MKRTQAWLAWAALVLPVTAAGTLVGIVIGARL